MPFPLQLIIPGGYVCNLRHGCLTGQGRNPKLSNHPSHLRVSGDQAFISRFTFLKIPGRNQQSSIILFHLTIPGDQACVLGQGFFEDPRVKSHSEVTSLNMTVSVGKSGVSPIGDIQTTTHLTRKKLCRSTIFYPVFTSAVLLRCWTGSEPSWSVWWYINDVNSF